MGAKVAKKSSKKVFPFAADALYIRARFVRLPLKRLRIAMEKTRKIGAAWGKLHGLRRRSPGETVMDGGNARLARPRDRFAKKRPNTGGDAFGPIGAPWIWRGGHGRENEKSFKY